MDHRHVVIVVDDDVNVRRLFSDTLEDADARVYIASTGEEAVRLAHETPELCVVLADVRMPRMDGWDLERVLRREMPDVPVVLVTADRLLSIRGASVRDKPVAPAEIEALVRTSCRFSQVAG
jgi:two-component system nitrogen regulation response regulator NtrX